MAQSPRSIKGQKDKRSRRLIDMQARCRQEVSIQKFRRVYRIQNQPQFRMPRCRLQGCRSSIQRMLTGQWSSDPEGRDVDAV